MRRVEEVLAVACDLAAATEWERDGALPELSEPVVAWLARLALHHPQVSAAVAAALPSSGVPWGMPWAETGERYAGAQRVSPDGARLGGVLMGTEHVSWRVPGVAVGDAPTVDAARAEVDERLLAAGYTLLGEVYRRAGVPAPAQPAVPVDDRCPRCNGTGESIAALTCPLCDGRGTVRRGST